MNSIAKKCPKNHKTGEVQQLESPSDPPTSYPPDWHSYGKWQVFSINRWRTFEHIVCCPYSMKLPKGNHHGFKMVQDMLIQSCNTQVWNPDVEMCAMNHPNHPQTGSDWLQSQLVVSINNSLPILDTLQKMTKSLLVNVDIPIDTQQD